jgi:hypothetical protein
VSHIEAEVGTARIVIDPVQDVEEVSRAGLFVARPVIYRPGDLPRALRLVLSSLDALDSDGIVNSALKTIEDVLGDEMVSV